MKDKFGLTSEDYAEQAQRRRALEFRDNMGRVVEHRKGNTMRTFSLAISIVALIVAVLVAIATRAHADVYIDTPHGGYTMGTFTPFGPAKIIHVTPPTTEEALDRDMKWMRDCRITFDMDKFGVMHYNFSRSPMGCEFGYLPGEVR